ncbi:MAG: hypothetical protein NZM16_03635, partial [Thermoflexus sp.]
YQPIVQALYDPAARDVHFETTITYEDGTVNEIRADLRIVDLEPIPAWAPAERMELLVSHGVEE